MPKIGLQVCTNALLPVHRNGYKKQTFLTQKAIKNDTRHAYANNAPQATHIAAHYLHSYLGMREYTEAEFIAFQAFINNLKELKPCMKVVKRLYKDEPEILDKKRATVKDRVEKLRVKMLRAQLDFHHIGSARFFQ
jgi:hypothetical protein